MNLSVTAAAPAPARPAPGSASGAGTGSAGAFQSLLEALAVLPGRRQVPGPPADVLLNAGTGDMDTAAGPGTPVPSTVLPADGTVPAPAGFSYKPASAAAELPAGGEPGAEPGAAAGQLAGSGKSAVSEDALADPLVADPHTPAVQPATAVHVPSGEATAMQPGVPLPSMATGEAAAPAAIAAPGTPAGPGLPVAATAAPAAAAGVLSAVANPPRTGGIPVSVPAGTAPASSGRAHPAAAPSFQLAALRGPGQPPGAAVFPALPVSAGETAVQLPEGSAGTAAASQLPGAAPAVAPSAAPALLAGPAAAAPAVPAAPPQLYAQLAKPVFSLLAAGDGEHVMTLKVTPESLGTVTVRAVIGTDGVRLELFAADAGREAVRAVLPDLRRELAGSGFNASLDLGSGSRPDGEPGQEEHRAPGRREAPENPVPAARQHDPVPTHPIPDGASALDILA
ncbi:MAG: flagellar hook-length control protein FliK [Arthrobacter sp.]